MRPGIDDALRRLDELVAYFEQHPDPEVSSSAAEMLRCIDHVHRTGIERLRAGDVDAPEALLLAELYGEGDQERADAVLDAVRPYVESHGGRLEVVAAAEGVVTVRLSGACQGCAGSSATLRGVVEGTLREGLPGFVAMRVAEGGADARPPAGFIPLTSIRERPRLGWHPVLPADQVPPGEARGVVVDGERVLIANVDGEMYAYRNACPETPFPLDGGSIEGGVLTCPFHGCRFDLRGGRRVGQPGLGLGVVPIAVENGMIRIGVLAQAA